MKNNIIRTRLVALLLVAIMAIGLTACSGGTVENPSTIIDPETGTVTEIPSPDANTNPFVNWGGWGTGSSSTDKDDDKSGDDGHVPGTPRESAPMKRWLAAYGETTTVVKSVKNPSTYDGKTSSNDNQYGTVDWSTANQGYVTFTAKGQERCFILEGPNGKQTLCTVAKGDSVEIALIDGTGKYQYAIANKTSDGTAHIVQYKNSFGVSKIDSDLAAYLISTPYGDYENAPNAVAIADGLWDTSKTQLENIKAIAKWVRGLNYDKSLKTGTISAPVNPDQVIANGGGVCNEMSKLLVAMLRSQGIPAYCQGGTNAKGNAHIWVMAWLELSTETKNGTTTSTGNWVLIEATSGTLQTQSLANKNYTPNVYAG